MRNDDIDGAKPKTPVVRQTHHPFNTNTDLPGSTPRHPNDTLRTQRRTDPLNPLYQLPTANRQEQTPDPSQKPAREILWTLPNHSPRVPSTRPATNSPPLPAEDLDPRSRATRLREQMQTRDILATADISGPQFRIEQPSRRVTDALNPTYIYDSGPLEPADTRRQHPGHRYGRKEHEAYSLRTDDIRESGPVRKPHSEKQVRQINSTADIPGAQADTLPTYGPRCWKDRDPGLLPEKVTNRVLDIGGTATGTGGIRETAPPPIYRARQQESARQREWARQSSLAR